MGEYGIVVFQGVRYGCVCFMLRLGFWVKSHNETIFCLISQRWPAQIRRHQKP